MDPEVTRATKKMQRGPIWTGDTCDLTSETTSDWADVDQSLGFDNQPKNQPKKEARTKALRKSKASLFEDGEEKGSQSEVEKRMLATASLH